MKKNLPRNRPKAPSAPPKPSPRLRKEAWYVLGALLLLPLVWWLSAKSPIDQFWEEKRIPELLTLGNYDSAVMIVDLALQDSLYQDIAEELQERRREILQQKLRQLYAPDYPRLQAQIDSLSESFLLYEAVSRIDAALVTEALEAAQNESLTEQREQLLDLARRIETRDTISILTSYTVSFGETLNGIAYRNGMSPQELIRINGLRNTQIKEGQRLRVRTPAKVDVHEVQRGEALSAIAAKYGMSLQEISRFNQLQSKDLIRIGQKLKVYQKVSLIPKKHADPSPLTPDTTAQQPRDTL
ncbi:MAG: LysM peptidoglycan-binding domain-containing protein [Bernardetiaceae bacterium]